MSLKKKFKEYIISSFMDILKEDETVLNRIDMSQSYLKTRLLDILKKEEEYGLSKSGVVFFDSDFSDITFYSPSISETPMRELFLKECEKSQAPWASFEVVGFDESKAKVQMGWNQSFIKSLHEMGFSAESDEETVQLFFYASRLTPSDLIENDEPVSEDLPLLGKEFK